MPSRERASDDAAWVREVLDRWERPLVGYARRLLGDLEAARDTAQEVFLRLWREGRAAVEPRMPAWLFAVCRNRALDERRRVARQATPSAAALEPAKANGRAAPARDDADDAARARAAIDALPDAHREVLVLRLLCGLSYAQVAEVTGLTANHVGVKVHEAMKALRARLALVEALRPVPEGDPR